MTLSRLSVLFHHPRVLLRVGLIGAWAAFVATVLFRSDHGAFNPWFDAGVYNVPFILASGACVLRSLQEPAAAKPWRLLAGGLVVFALGNLYSSLVLVDQEVYPSVADGLWLAFYFVIYCAIVTVARSSTERFHASTWIDGAIVGMGTASLVAGFVLDRVLADTEGDPAVVATNLAYPVADLVLVVALVIWSTIQRRPSPAAGWLAIGLFTLGIGDVVFLYQSANGSYAEGGLLDVSWPLGAVFIGLSSLTRRSIIEQRTERRPPFVVPCSFAAVAVAMLVYGQSHDMSTVTVILMVATLVAAALRTLWTVREVTRLSSSRDEARTDELTGLANRRAFIEAVDAAVEQRTRCAVVIVDLDEFKRVNDELGHDLGDQLLRRVGRELRDALPSSVVARLGGDEFGLLIELHEDEQPLHRVQRVADRLCGKTTIDTHIIEVAGSFGVAIAPTPDSDRRDLLRAADAAMYRAKRARSRVHLHDPQDPTNPRALRALIESGTDVAFQPVIDLATGNIESLEALVRLKLPDGSVLVPADFLDEIEHAHLQQLLTERVLGHALSFAASIAGAHPDVSVRANIFASDLCDPRLARNLAQMLGTHRVDGSALIIEVTESAFSAKSSMAAGTVQALREMGVKVAIDDFGAGHASFARLLELEVDELKLDELFARNVANNPRTRALVLAAIQLGEALDLRVVAEGVETREVAHQLAFLGCHAAQGFHYSEPLPALATRELLDRRLGAGHRPAAVSTWPSVEFAPSRWRERDTPAAATESCGASQVAVGSES
jgi:diguanylate cyclase